MYSLISTFIKVFPGHSSKEDSKIEKKRSTSALRLRRLSTRRLIVVSS